MERGRRNLEESIHNENHWPQLHVLGVDWNTFHLFRKKMHFKVLKFPHKLKRWVVNYKLENRIPWRFTDFDNIKDFPWLFTKFPDFSLTVATLVLQHHYKANNAVCLQCMVRVLHWEFAEGFSSPEAKCKHYPWRRHASKQWWTVNEIGLVSPSPWGEGEHLCPGSQKY